jgi:4-hydroxybenzoate polyprenyltransferase
MAPEEPAPQPPDADHPASRITLETPEGRTNLRGESIPEGEGPGPRARMLDPDLDAIDSVAHEAAPAEGERYPGWRVGVPRKIAAYVELIRPFTLLAPVFGGIGGAVLALAAGDFEEWVWPSAVWTMVYGITTLVLLNAASNCLNGAYDAHIDAINKPYRPIPRGLVTRDEAVSLAYALYFLAFFRALLISPAFWAIVMLVAATSYYYSMPPVRFKKRFWLSNISIAFGRGMLGFVAAWTLFGDPLNPTPWVIGGIMFIFLVGATTSKDFTDVEGDRRYGMRTLPVVYGPRRAALIATPFFVGPFLLIPLGVLRGYLVQEANILLVLSVWGVYVMYLLQGHANERDPNFENSPVWKHMYMMLFALQLGFAAVYVYHYLSGR